MKFNLTVPVKPYVKRFLENSFPYLEITEKGKTEIYGIEPVWGTESILSKPIRTKKQK